MQHFQIAAVLHFDFMFNESLSRNEIKKKAVIAKGYGSNLRRIVIQLAHINDSQQSCIWRNYFLTKGISALSILDASNVVNIGLSRDQCVSAVLTTTCEQALP